MSPEQLRAECITVLATMGEITSDVAANLAQDVSADLDFARLTFDSLSVLDFCIRLEEKAGIYVEPADLAYATGLNQFVRTVAVRPV